jgi:cell division inhibitor SulA
MFSGVVLVDSRPERSLSSTDVHPSFKHLYHKKVLRWLVALSPKASCSIQWVSAAVILRLKQNLVQMHFCLKSVISVVKKIHRITKT